MRPLPGAEPSRALAALAKLQSLPRAGLGTWPTPLELRSDLDGRPLWVKRDDLSGLGRGGAKARKIDLLIGHMLAHGHNELITIAGNVTNLAFDLLPALDRFGLEPGIMILDDPPLPPAERERIFEGVRQRLQLLPAARGRAALAAARRGTRALASGRKPLLVLPGGSHPVGVLGNALGFLEMAAQLEARNEALPSTVFVTAATGTTLAGFLLAEWLLRHCGRSRIRVVGAAAYGGATAVRTRALLAWTARSLGLPAWLPDTHIEIDDSALCGGFGRFGAREQAVCEQVEKRVGVRVDPVFGGKTWAVLHDRLAHSSERTDRYPLYWHCGYTPEWQLLGAAVNRR